MNASIDEHEDRLRYSIDLLDRTGRFIEPSNVDLREARAPHDPVAPIAATQGCVDLLERLFVRFSTGRPPPPANSTALAATEATAARPRRGKTVKLAQAVESVQSRVAGLEERALALRAQVGKHLADGQRSKAMLALKRAKGVEKQAHQAQATALALESQVDAIENQQMASQVTEALSAAMKSSKRSSKGLLNRAEGAMDDAHEIADLASDVGAMWGELNPTVLDEDDDALEAELNEMVAEEPRAAPEAADAAHPVGSVGSIGSVVTGMAKVVRAMPTPPKHTTGATEQVAAATV